MYEQFLESYWFRFFSAFCAIFLTAKQLLNSPFIQNDLGKPVPKKLFIHLHPVFVAIIQFSLFLVVHSIFLAAYYPTIW